MTQSADGAFQQSVNGLRVALVVDSLLFTRVGGLQRQIQETLCALGRIGVDAEIVSAGCSSLSEYDLAHVFDAESCAFQIIQYVKKIGLPVVLSPVISTRWNAKLGFRARWADRLATWITGNFVKTTYAQTLWALSEADHLIALGEKERIALTKGFGIEKTRVTVVPNGVSEKFFQADSEVFTEQTDIEPGFILNIGSICNNKNQVTLAKVAAELGRQLVCIGPPMQGEGRYYDELLAFPNVVHLGIFSYDDPLLVSAYAAASVFALPSFSEVMPLTVLESLAAGTPVAMTRVHAMDARFPDWALNEIDPGDAQSLLGGISGLLEVKPSEERLKDLVRSMTWVDVAERLNKVYADTINGARL